MRQWRPPVVMTSLWGLVRDATFRTVTGLRYQDPISLFRFMKFINTKFQRTLLRDYVELIVLVGLDWKQVPFTPPFHYPHVVSKKLTPFLCQMIFSIWS